MRQAAEVVGDDVLLQLIGLAIGAWLVLPLMDRRLPGTPGKRLLGLHLICTDGRPAGFMRALIRTLSMHLSHVLLPVVMVFLEVLIFKRPLHDRISGLHLVQPEEHRSPVLRAATAQRRSRSGIWAVLGWLLLPALLMAIMALLVDLFFLNSGAPA